MSLYSVNYIIIKLYYQWIFQVMKNKQKIATIIRQRQLVTISPNKSKKQMA